MANEKQLVIEIRDKIATLKSKNFNLVGGNNDYDVVFDFDEQWQKYPTKTAVFVYGKNAPVYKVFEGNICEGVAISGSTMCLIGVFSGDLVTSTPACVECVYRSILDEAGGEPQPPSEDVYNQIMDLLNRYINAAQGAPKGGKAGQVLKKNSDKDYDFSWQNDETGGSGGGAGISPTIVISPIDNGHRVTITDINGTQTFDIMNGEKGDSGYTPQKGIDYWNAQDIAEMQSYIDEKIAPIINEIEGVEETLQMINEGGIEQ